jgi:hypothetical protein
VSSIAVADIEAVLCAVAPDRALHEPRKGGWKPRIELPGIDMGGDEINDACAAARPIARLAVRVIGGKPSQDPSAVQVVVDEGVHGNKVGGGFGPQRLLLAAGKQQKRYSHGQDLVREAVHVADR